MDRLLCLAVLLITFTLGVARSLNYTHGTEFWPEPRNENETLFTIPKKLAINNKILISAKMKQDTKNFSIALLSGNNSSDFANIIYQMEVHFSPKIQMFTRQRENNIQELDSDYIQKDDAYLITINVREMKLIMVFVNGNIIDNAELLYGKVDDIRFLSVSGDMTVPNIKFNFFPD